MTLQEVLDKYFRDERMVYFHQSDHHKQIEGDTFLRYYEKSGYGGKKIELWFGGDNGEVCILCTDDPEKLETLINLIING